MLFFFVHRCLALVAVGCCVLLSLSVVVIVDVAWCCCCRGCWLLLVCLMIACRWLVLFAVGCGLLVFGVVVTCNVSCASCSLVLLVVVGCCWLLLMVVVVVAAAAVAVAIDIVDIAVNVVVVASH